MLIPLKNKVISMKYGLLFKTFSTCLLHSFLINIATPDPLIFLLLFDQYPIYPMFIISFLLIHCPSCFPKLVSDRPIILMSFSLAQFMRLKSLILLFLIPFMLCVIILRESHSLMSPLISFLFFKVLHVSLT